MTKCVKDVATIAAAEITAAMNSAKAVLGIQIIRVPVQRVIHRCAKCAKGTPHWCQLCVHSCTKFGSTKAVGMQTAPNIVALAKTKAVSNIMQNM